MARKEGELDFRKTLFCTLIAFGLSAGMAVADDVGFGSFKKEPINAPGSYKIVKDSTGAAPAAKLHSFTITPGACSDRKYTNGNSDCTFKSVRSQAYETEQKQPHDAWYAWDMYFPSDFPVGLQQPAAGFYQFAYWHNGECQNLTLASETANGTALFLQTQTFVGGDCQPAQRLPVADLKSLRGRWHRVEMHVVWSRGADGLAEIWLDGKFRQRLSGRNITAGAPARNYFKFGIYLCCTKGTELIAPATMYYTTPVRAKTRNGLH
jgi:hypothetical protein